VAIDPATGKMVEGGITEQTARVLNNIKAILLAAGYSPDNVVKSTCLLSDMSTSPRTPLMFSAGLGAGRQIKSCTRKVWWLQMMAS